MSSLEILNQFLNNLQLFVILRGMIACDFIIDSQVCKCSVHISHRMYEYTVYVLTLYSMGSATGKS